MVKMSVDPPSEVPPCQPRKLSGSTDFVIKLLSIHA
jgi:hypothetical protein